MIDVLQERTGVTSQQLREQSIDEGSDPTAGLNFSQSERFHYLLDETRELLKLASGVSKFKNINICQHDTLAHLFHVANLILIKEQKRDERTSPKAENQDGQQSNCFIYRSDIKEMILILLSLCEYNLRIVFSAPTS